MQILNSSYKKFSNKSDQELVAEFKATANNMIVGEFYKRYHHIVFGICLKYLKNQDAANDAQSQIFTELFHFLKKYEIKEFKSWLFTITRNFCLRKLKTNAKSVPFINDAENNISIEFMENEDEIAHIKYKETQIKKLEEALNQLKPEQKTCIEMFYLENKTYQEIESHTGFELKKVKSYIQNGKRNLEILMNRMNKK